MKNKEEDVTACQAPNTLTKRGKVLGKMIISGISNFDLDVLNVFTDALHATTAGFSSWRPQRVKKALKEKGPITMALSIRG